MRKARDYRKEYRDYHGKPNQIRDRASRNGARAAAVKSGKASKGDGKHVDHKDNNPRNNASGNVRVMPRKANHSRPRRKI